MRRLIAFLRGSTPRRPSEIARSALGAALGVACVGLATPALTGGWGEMTLAAPLAASAVLVFAVPAAPLAQPRAVIGGNVLAALIGVACRLGLGDALLAGPAATGLSIAAMLLLGCLHPPAAAVALVAAVGQEPVGWGYAATPIGLGSALMCLAGALYAPLVGRAYPHAPPSLAAPEPTRPPEPRETRSFASLEGVTSGAAMTRELFYVTPQMTAEAALKVLTDHALRTAPVLDDERRVLGIVRRAELLLEIEREATEGAGTGRPVAELAEADVATVSPQTALAAVLPMLATGALHEVVVVDAAGAAIGVITQTDLLAAVWRGGRPA